MDFKKIMDKYFKNSKKLMMNMVILLLFGVLLILIGDIAANLTTEKTPVKKNAVEVNAGTENQSLQETYEQRTKRELTETLSKIQGVGQLSVMIYFDGGSAAVPAMNINNNNSRTEEKDNQGGQRVTTENSKSQNIVLVNQGGENKPFILRQYNPSIGGVVVVAEGASNSIIRERLLIAVKTALNLPANRVSILPMK